MLVVRGSNIIHFCCFCANRWFVAYKAISKYYHSYALCTCSARLDPAISDRQHSWLLEIWKFCMTKLIDISHHKQDKFVVNGQQQMYFVFWDTTKIGSSQWVLDGFFRILYQCVCDSQRIRTKQSEGKSDQYWFFATQQ